MKHNIKQIIYIAGLAAFLAVIPSISFFSSATTTPSAAAATLKCADGSTVDPDKLESCPVALSCKEQGGKQICTPAKENDNCGGVKTSIDFGCKNSGNPVMDLLLAVIRFLTVGVGLVLILMTVISGIQYTVAQGDAAATKAVKLRLLGIGVALAIYLLGMAILNYVVPGGILG